jgi:lipoyl-dependent peroxiredoxin
MPTRTARTAWTGTLEQGVGKVELTSSRIGTCEVSFPRRAADDAGGYTSPEELIAAAHSACYAMQLSAPIGQAGGTPQVLDVQADVSLGPDPAGGFRLTGIKLTVRGEVDGLDDAQFAQAAQAAKAGCPVSKALTGVAGTPARRSSRPPRARHRPRAPGPSGGQSRVPPDPDRTPRQPQPPPQPIARRRPARTWLRLMMPLR